MLTLLPVCSLSQKSPLAKPVTLGNADTLKVILTAKENGKGKRPHQAFLVLQEPKSGLEAPFPLTVKETGKAVVQIVSRRGKKKVHTHELGNKAC